MAEAVWSQDIFSKGELSPMMYSRVTVDAYYNGLKTARNTITYPQGGIGKRFGTLFNAQVEGITDYTQSYFESFQYDDECTYIIIVIPGSILIYLEGTLISTVTATVFTAPVIPLIDSTVIENNFRMTSSALPPYDLVRDDENVTPNNITAAASDEITLNTAVTADLILPTSFGVSGGTIIVTTPQVMINQNYFLYTTSTTTAEIYATAQDAKARTNKFTVTSVGTGTSTAIIKNDWTLGVVTFSNLPVFDFNDVDYSAVTFTPGDVSGFNQTLTASGASPAIFTNAYIGGGFAGNGGIARIISRTSSTVICIDILESFKNTAGIPGNRSLLFKPAWSDEKGWPSKCSSFQNRAIFANTRSLPNGLWASVTNDYDDFDGLQDDDDNSIFWYPSSDNVNVIRFIVPYRSLTIHTNTGIYSTPLTFEQAITPNNFSMTLQESTPASVIQPRALDNQIISIAGNDVHAMLWDGFNNSYTSNIASIASEHLIRNPTDEAAYIDRDRAGSRYMFIVNGNGDLTVYQTLVSENISGFTPTDLTQTYGNAYFRWAAGSDNGRAWFMTEREIAVESSPDNISGVTDSTITLTTPNTFEVGVTTAFKISATTSFPEASITFDANTWYWAVGTDTTNINVYTSYADAEAEENAVKFINSGDGASVTPWPLETQFFLEELSFDVFTDCTYTYSGTAQATFTGLERFNAQMVKAVGDGYGFDQEGNDDEVTLTAHGQEVEASEVSIGFPITTVIEPLNIAVPGVLNYKGSSLTFPQHIRAANLMFNETIGGTVNDQPIQFTSLIDVAPGSPPAYASGTMETTPMLGWNNDAGSINITHDDPFDIRLIGLFYRIEV
jgi:hypothetical protein